MSEILIIRHAQGSFGGDYDNLSEKGHVQSRLLAEYLYNYRLSEKSIDAIYCGTLRRQHHTAQIMIDYYASKGAHLPVLNIDDRLNEYDTVNIMKTIVPTLLMEQPELNDYINHIYTDKKAFQIIFEKAMRRWVSLSEHPDGVETFSEVKQRVKNVLDDIINENGRGKNIIIITSGGIIGTIMHMTLGLEDSKILQLTWQIVNTSMTHLRYNDGGLMLASFNVFPHIELCRDPSMKTYR